MTKGQIKKGLVEINRIAKICKVDCDSIEHISKLWQALSKSKERERERERGKDL